MAIHLITHIFLHVSKILLRFYSRQYQYTCVHRADEITCKIWFQRCIESSQIIITGLGGKCIDYSSPLYIYGALLCIPQQILILPSPLWFLFALFSDGFSRYYNFLLYLLCILILCLQLIISFCTLCFSDLYSFYLSIAQGTWI